MGDEPRLARGAHGRGGRTFYAIGHDAFFCKKMHRAQPWRANLESRTRGYTTPTVDERMERLRTETNIQAQERQRENMERFNRQMNSSIADSRRRDAERLKQNAAAPFGPSFYKDKNGLWRPRPR